MSRRSSFAATLALTVATVGASATAAIAAPPEKVQLCHWAGDGYVLIEVAPTAADAHLEHHDGDAVVGDGVDAACEELPDEAAVLARATSTDAQGAEVLVAQLEDTNGDGVASVGDTVVTGALPVGFDGTSYDAFTVTEHPVDDVVFISSSVIRVGSGTGDFEWSTDFGGQDGEAYLEVDGQALTLIIDGRSERRSQDLLFIDAGSPSAPTTSGFVSTDSAADDAHLTVEFPTA